jgi:hypothetical protein
MSTDPLLNITVFKASQVATLKYPLTQPSSVPIFKPKVEAVSGF